MSQNTLKNWIQALRPFSYTASMIPAVLGAAWAVYEKTPADWRLMPLIILASFAIHAATNLINDYFDYIKGVDQKSSLGGSRVIVEEKLSPMQVLIGGLVLFALTAAIGLGFIYLRGWPILVIGLIGMLGGFFYTAAPIGYKYWGLGDAMVFLLMGPLMVIGSYFVLTGQYNNHVLFVSLPIGCLVAAILSGNNLRDIPHDSQAGIKTTAGVLGHRFARIEYCFLLLSAYLIHGGLIAFRIVPMVSLAAILTIPLAYKLIQQALHSRADMTSPLAGIDVRTAQLHLGYGAILIASFFFGTAGK